MSSVSDALKGIKGILGEPKTGYENEDGKGEFECENCHYYDPKDSSCGESNMVKNSRQPMNDRGRREVEPEGCCEFVDRIGKEIEDGTNGR